METRLQHAKRSCYKTYEQGPRYRGRFPATKYTAITGSYAPRYCTLLLQAELEKTIIHQRKSRERQKKLLGTNREKEE